MKVILLTELKGRGGEGDVVEVARGFATNYLLPRKIAIEATSGNLKQLEQRRHNIKQREDVRLAEAGDFRGVLDGKKVNIYVKVGEAGRLFGSVTALMIAEAIQEQLGIEVDRRKIETHGAIKTTGEHDVEVSVYREIKAHLTVDVVAEGTIEVSEEEAKLAAEVAAAESGVEPEASEDSAAAEDAEAADAAEAEVEAAEAEVEAAEAEAEVEEAVEELAEELADELVEEEVAAEIAEVVEDIAEAIVEEAAAEESVEEATAEDASEA
jgi:large subunit ribosomal protein L9